jgi:N-acetylmuramoyl-L-alanine amidase
MPSTLVEMGFVTGSLDAPRLMDANFRRQMAVALATGVLTYLQNTAQGLR